MDFGMAAFREPRNYPLNHSPVGNSISWQSVKMAPISRPHETLSSIRALIMPYTGPPSIAFWELSNLPDEINFRGFRQVGNP
jgi:hypothetical protein